MKQSIIPRIPLGHFAYRKKTARAVVFLASEDSSYMADSDLEVDGGVRQI